MVKPLKSGGYMALITILILGAAATSISFTLLLTATDSQRTEMVEQQSHQARALAVACGQEALQRIHDNIAYSGTSSMKLGQDSCTFSSTATSATVRTINVAAVVGTVERRITATVSIGSAAIVPTAWQDVATAAVTPAFVQNATQTPGSASSVATAFPVSQTAGNLNVVVIGFSGITSTISSVTDTLGNSYQVAAAMTRSSTESQVVYYAKNITAGSNTVTVNFNASTSFPDIRIAEYSGLDQLSPLTANISATGTSAAASSGSLATSPTLCLLVGAATTSGSFTAPGTSFSERVITSDSNILEDRLVTPAGSYAATATLASSSSWVAQGVAFKAAGQ